MIDKIKFSKRQAVRYKNLLPDGIPRYVRCYDNQGETFDRYTVCFTGNYRRDPYDDFLSIGMSSDPFHPQGFYQHDGNQQHIDHPAYAHLGKKIQFEDLPKDCQTAVIDDYLCIWKFTDANDKQL